MVQGFGGGGRQRVHIRNVHSLMSLLPLCYSTHKSSFCEEERVQRWPSFSLSSSTGGENGCVPKDFNQKHAGCRETSGVFCCERGAGCRVRGSGLWWRLRRKYLWGDARKSANGRFPSYRQPSPLGEGACVDTPSFLWNAVPRRGRRLDGESGIFVSQPSPCGEGAP